MAVPYGPVGVMVGEYRMPAHTRQALLEAVGGGDRLRPGASVETLIGAVEHAVAEYRAWIGVPNGEHFAQPRETTRKELDAVQAAAEGMIAALQSLSDETRARLGEKRDHSMQWWATGLRNRCWNALADLSEESRRKGPQPHVASRNLAAVALSIFEIHIGPATYSGNEPSAWTRFLEEVFGAAGAPIDAREIARQLVCAARRK